MHGRVSSFYGRRFGEAGDLVFDRVTCTTVLSYESDFSIRDHAC